MLYYLNEQEKLDIRLLEYEKDLLEYYFLGASDGISYKYEGDIFFKLVDLYDKKFRLVKLVNYLGGINDFESLALVKKNLEKVNDLVGRYRNLHSALMDVIKVNTNIRYYLNWRTSLVHLIYTNNDAKMGKMYSCDSYRFLCRFHRENNPSLGVAHEKNLYYCFGCGFSGFPSMYLRKYHNLTGCEVTQLLARIYLIDVVKNGFDVDDDIVVRYRETLVSDEFRQLLQQGYERLLGKDMWCYSDICGMIRYENEFEMIERVRLGKVVEYQKFKKSKKLILR